MRHAPDAATIEALAQKALDAMPEAFRAHLGDIVFQVEDFADAEALAAVGLDDPWELSGLYEGRPLTEQSIWDSGSMPPRIRLFRRPLLEEWVETGVALDDLIAHVIIHQVGHHFGFSDEDMHAIEEGRGLLLNDLNWSVSGWRLTLHCRQKTHQDQSHDHRTGSDRAIILAENVPSDIRAC